MSKFLTRKAGSSVQLPPVFAIGFTGHRHLDDEKICKQALHEILAEQKATPEKLAYAVTSVAAGADLLFAETCIELSVPLLVLLPFPQEEFRKDFDAATWSRAEGVMRHALSVEVIGNEQAREERYYECGLEVVQQSQLLIAVWDGKPAKGRGGTAEIVDFAQQMDRTVVWISSETGDVQRIAGKISQERVQNAELIFLNALPDCGTVAEDESPTALCEAWLAKLDANAAAVAPQVRRLAAAPILCTALAAFFSGIAPRVHTYATWAGVGAALGLAATLSPLVLRLGPRQALWVRIRLAAEVTRSIVALWDTPERYQVVGREVLPDLEGMIRSLGLLKARVRQQVDEDVEEFKQTYLATRVQCQMRYFSGQVKKAAAQSHKYRLIGKFCTVVAIATSLWMFGAHTLFKSSPAISGGSWLAMLTSALFQTATVIGALLIVYDCDRRQRRYQELYEVLSVFELELRAFRTWPPVTRLASRVERALLVELLEWRSLLQNRKMPRD